MNINYFFQEVMTRIQIVWMDCKIENWKLRFATAVTNVAIVKYSTLKYFLFAPVISNKFFLSREDICRAREKCDTLGELFFFNQYDLTRENL